MTVVSGPVIWAMKAMAWFQPAFCFAAMSMDLSTVIQQDGIDQPGCSFLQHLYKSETSSNSHVFTASFIDQVDENLDPDVDWQKDWLWRSCSASTDDVRRCCSKFDSTAAVTFDLQRVVLIAFPKTASVDLQISFELWLHCKDRVPNDFELPRFHYALPHGMTFDQQGLDSFDVDLALFDEYRCATSGGCMVVSTFRKPASQLVSAYVYHKCSRDLINLNFDNTKCDAMAKFDQETLLRDFFNDTFNRLRHLNLGERFKTYFHDIAAALSSVGYPAQLALDQSQYDNSTGFLELELQHVDAGKPLKWLLLDFEHVSEWESIIANYASGFKLLDASGAEHRVPNSLQEAYKIQEYKLSEALKDPTIWPTELLKQVMSWDCTTYFYSAPY